MDERFKIFFEHLRDGGTDKIDITCDPDFLEVSDEALFFTQPVKIKGEAYLTDDTLILHLNIATSASISCSICNAPVTVPLELTNFYHTEQIEELKSGCFNFQQAVREAILLEVPAFAECHEGNCPDRKGIAKFLKKPTSAKNDGHQPFADINLDQFKL
jgi:uncharacterized metal-binding protein YceD (DUF177 family)